MTTQTYNINEAEANFFRLMDEVASGKEVIIGREGIPLARISRIDPNVPKIRFDVLKGRAMVTEDFDAPLPDDLLSEFEGGRCGS